jgi:hypothetical protein
MKRIEISVGHATAVQMSHYTALVEVASAALGGGKDKKPAITEDLSNVSVEDFVARVNMLGTV